MNYAEIANAALRKYDELVESRNAIAGKEVTDEVRSQVAALDADIDAALEEVRSAKAQADRAEEAESLRSKVSSLYVAKNDIRSDSFAQEFRQAVSKTGEGMVLNTRGLTFGKESRAAVLSAQGAFSEQSLTSAALGAIYDETSVLKAGALVIGTNSNGLIDVPRLDNVNPALVPEGGAFPETTTASKTSLSAYKYGAIAHVSTEMIQDAGQGVVSLVAAAVSNAVRNFAAVDLLVGNGTNKPTGVLTDATKGATAAAAAVTEQDVYALFYSVKRPTAWVMNGTTAAAIRSLDSGLWSVNPGSDNPNVLLGLPVIIDENMPNIGAGNKSVVLGDFSKYFVRQVNGLRIDRSEDYKFGNDLTSIRVAWQVDGVLLDSKAVKFLQHGA